MQSTLGGNCSSIAPLSIEREGTRIQVTGGRIEVNPKINGVLYTGAGLEWDLYLLVERGKNDMTFDGRSVFPQQHYTQPVGDYPDTVNPLEPYVANRPCTAGFNEVFPDRKSVV